MESVKKPANAKRIANAKKFGIAAIVCGLLLAPTGIVVGLTATAFAVLEMDSEKTPEQEKACKVAMGCGLIGAFLGAKISLIVGLMLFS